MSTIFIVVQGIDPSRTVSWFTTLWPYTIGGKSEGVESRELVHCVKDTCCCLLGKVLPYFNPWIPIFDPILLIMTK